jgi:hypothetical protein
MLVNTLARDWYPSHGNGIPDIHRIDLADVFQH